MEDYTDLLEILKTQLWYFTNLMDKRNQYRDQATITKISHYWNAGEKRSPLELAYHGLTPLNQLCEIILDPTKQWGDTEIKPLDLDNSSEEFITLYRLVLDKADKALSKVDRQQFIGNMTELRENKELFEKRLKILCMHAVTHYGQAMKFQGMICNELEESQK